MQPPELAAFKYAHDGPADLSPARRRFVRVSFVLALIVALVGFPVGLVAFLVPLIARASVPKVLQIGPRYLICGRRIVYYANVVRLRREEDEGRLRLEFGDGEWLELLRERFPTNARKADKIARNKAAKFGKVADKLAQKVRAASPEAEVVGFAG